MDSEKIFCIYTEESGRDRRAYGLGTCALRRGYPGDAERSG